LRFLNSGDKVLKDKIINYSKEIGIDLIGFTDASINEQLKEKLILKDKLGYNSSFEKGSIEERTNPKLLMEDSRTIIAIALAYSKTHPKKESLKEEEVYFSSSSWGIDYHKVIKDKLTLLVDFIKKEVPNFHYKIVSDTSPLCDRTIAYQAGLGFFGKNNLLINPKYGSYIFLGSLLTNLRLDIDKPLTLNCSNCNKCLNACPTGALNENGVLNTNKCLSYITQKKELTEEESKLINQCIYGCDICMSVCPYNKNNNKIHEEFLPDGIEFININEYEPLSNRKFKRKYGHLSGSWRGPKIINRNIRLYKDKIK
jgi:epoxyqueuosine reductase